jgi:hypothetical protein
LRAGIDLSACPRREIEIRGRRAMLAVRTLARAAELPSAGSAAVAPELRSAMAAAPGSA